MRDDIFRFLSDNWFDSLNESEEFISSTCIIFVLFKIRIHDSISAARPAQTPMTADRALPPTDQRTVIREFMYFYCTCMRLCAGRYRFTVTAMSWYQEAHVIISIPRVACLFPRKYIQSQAWKGSIWGKSANWNSGFMMENET